MRKKRRFVGYKVINDAFLFTKLSSFYCFPHIQILRILTEHKQCYGTEPDGAGEGGEIGDLVGAAAGEGGLELGGLDVVGEVALGGGGDDNLLFCEEGISV